MDKARMNENRVGQGPEGEQDFGRNLAEAMLTKLVDWMDKQPVGSVSEAHQKAFVGIVEALPEGKVKGWVAKLEQHNKFFGKVSEKVMQVQDAVWKIAKSVLVEESPIVATIPDNVFSQFEARQVEMRGRGWKWLVETAGPGVDNVVNRIIGGAKPAAQGPAGA
jgi:hypothetical protein